MKIAYLSTHYPFVSHTFIQREIAGIEAHGFEVFPIALNQARDTDLLSELDHTESARTFYVKGMSKGRIIAALAATGSRHPVAMLRGLRRAASGTGLDLATAMKRELQFLEAVLVWRHCARHRVTAIHAHFGQAPSTVAQFAAAFGDATGRGVRTWSATMHGWQEFATEDSSDLERKINDADLVVGVSDFTRAQLMRLSDPARWDRIAVVRCGLALQEFPRRATRAMAVTPVVVSTARLSPEKGHLVLIEAIALLRDRGVPMRARLIGSGPFRATIEATVAELGLHEVIELTGPLSPSAVAAELGDADIFCLPTFAEGLPVSIMEAMTVGVPVVTTYISGIPELVIDGVSGFVVPAANAALLADKLLEVARCSDLLPLLDTARARIDAQHDITVNAAQLAALFRRRHGDPDRSKQS